MKLKAVIFDLDGVLVSTDEYHYLAWKKIADEQGIYFDREINHRLRGVSRMASLDIVLERASKTYTQEEKEEMAARKNAVYVESLSALTPEDLLPGAAALLDSLKEAGVKIAVGSSSKNTPLILKQIGLKDKFDAVIDGSMISRSKPDPEVFSKAAAAVSARPEECIVMEDAEAGIEAALAAGMTAVGVVAAVGNLPGAHAVCHSLEELTPQKMEDILVKRLSKG